MPGAWLRRSPWLSLMLWLGAVFLGLGPLMIQPAEAALTTSHWEGMYFCKCICFGTNYTILPIYRPTNAAKPCLTCTKRWCADQKLPICLGADVGEIDPDTGTGKEGDIEGRCFQRDSPRDQVVVTLFLLTVFGLLIGAAIRGRMERAGVTLNAGGRPWWANDDGPPSHESPYIFGLYMELTRKLGWDVKVVIPSSQKSWIGKAYQIKDTIKGAYYYPKGPNGNGCTSEVSRPLEEDEVGEWILLDGGTFKGFKPTKFTDDANVLACKIIARLWEDWGKDTEGLRNGDVDLYNDGIGSMCNDTKNPRTCSVNLPMIPELGQPNGIEVVWTTVWRNAYGMLFKPKEEEHASRSMREAGPDAPQKTPDKPSTPVQSDELPTGSTALSFHFAPANMTSLVNPPLDKLPYGSDTWAILNAKASVTPLRAAFMECSPESYRLSSEEGEKGSWVPGRPFKL
ncbi:hypothetical protein FRB97_005663 [Tulasnella sp. 331]|nr:hypothetical protein FRB97_005663 [Tulasnella sp. 331]